MKYFLIAISFILGCLIGENLSDKEQAARESTSKETCWVKTPFKSQVKAQLGPKPKGLKYCLKFKGYTD